MKLLGMDILLKYAIQIEENGAAFYRHWANCVEDQNQKNFFNSLAVEEIEHKTIFEGMMDQLKVSDFQPQGIDNKEYEEYLQKIVHEVLFNKNNFEEESKNVKSITSAVEFALKQEMDTLIFYSDLKIYISKEYLEVMNKIIKEEQNHCAVLEEFRVRLLKHENAAEID